VKRYVAAQTPAAKPKAKPKAAVVAKSGGDDIPF
jgi:hypothetical protein